jgi:ribulose-5-phosphate 4-epimerase/fuculose-1-phosphate aldolase
MDDPPLHPHHGPPAFATLEEERVHRKSMCALGYRVFGGLRWGQLGDGHISARDPGRTDHFWLLRYGVPFARATVADLVLVSPEGDVVEGDGGINVSAYNIHHPIHAARPEVVSAAHVHTGYGTPWAAKARPFAPISQEACAFSGDQALFDDDELDIVDTSGGERIAKVLGPHKLVILRNHGLLTVGGTVEEAVGWFVMAERVAEAHVKMPAASPVSFEAAAEVAKTVGTAQAGWHVFQWLVRDLIPDPSVVES